jgi:hypothetical protein
MCALTREEEKKSHSVSGQVEINQNGNFNGAINF